MVVSPWCDRVLIDPGVQLSLLELHQSTDFDVPQFPRGDPSVQGQF